MEFIIFLIIMLILSVILAVTSTEISSGMKTFKLEAKRAESYEEYKYWKNKIKAQRMSIIPGISPKRAEKIFSFFGRGKRYKKKEVNTDIIQLLMPSFIGIGICCVCLVGGTYAWFTASQTTSVSNITAAQHSVNTEISTEQEAVLPNSDGSYTLNAGEYTVKLSAVGNASNGYCRLNIGDKTATTAAFPIENENKNFEFTLVITGDNTPFIITPYWGKLTGNETLIINNGDRYVFTNETE